MAEDDVELHFTRRELQVFALWADAARDDGVTERLIGDSKGMAAYKRAFDTLDKAAWGGPTNVADVDPEPQSVSESAIEYRVRCIEGNEADAIERACNEQARDGWRLVTATTAAVSTGDCHTCLFFARPLTANADAIARAAIRLSTIQTH